MADKVKCVISEYQQRLMEKPFVPRSSFGRYSLGEDGDANKLFLSYLFIDMDLGIQFLKDVGLIRSKVTCNTCGRDMTWCADPKRKSFRWRCRRRSVAVCSESKSIKHGSWFQHTNLTFQEVMFLTYDIVRRVPARRIKQEHHYGFNTLADWGQFCREEMLSYIQGCSEKIGGPNKTVEIDESKFGKRKYGRGHPVKGQWVFGGVERESGRTFLVPVPDRTADTLMAVIDAWIEPGTTVISDCWGAYRNLDTRGYTHRTVNHSIGFVNHENDAHTNTIESTWRHVKAYLNPYNRKGNYIYHLAHYMFAARCRAEGVDQFTKFLHLVATKDWSQCPPPRIKCRVRSS